jgi:dTDP-4-amino-4,6-dideoxygalactose transaminase
MRIQRHLAPTAAPVSWSDIGRALMGLVRGRRYRAGVEAEMKRYFGVKHLYLLSSGKAALTIILRALAAQSPRRKVVIPAYTCFSVPSAIVRAGCQVVLCDVDPHTLDFDFANLQSVVDADTLCIVSPHLLGQVSDIQRVQALARPYQVPVIEDAAQVMGARSKGRLFGTQGDIGMFSLGRGKNVTAGSGGVILTNSEDLARQLAIVYQDIPESSVASRIVNVMIVGAMKLLIHPRAYWLPAGLPFLGIGETTFDRDFPICRLDGARAGLLATWRQRLEQSSAIRARRAQQYFDYRSHELDGLEPGRIEEAAYLRVPVIMPTAEKKRALCALGAKEGLGLSPLYPTPISQIPELKSLLPNDSFPGSQILADRLVTLPVHQYVEESDISRICTAIRTLVNGMPSGQDSPACASGPGPYPMATKAEEKAITR